MNNTIYVIPHKKNKGILKFEKSNIETTAYIGRNGLTTKKREGDGKTPIGEFELGLVLGTHKKIKSKLEYIQITKNMYWVDDIKSKYYNRLVDIENVEKDWNSAEHLIDYPIQYEYIIEIKTNPNNTPGNGSAIFLHCTNHAATAGCIAIESETMKTLIESIDENTKIIIMK